MQEFTRDFRRLRERFHEARAAAAKIDSPNPEDQDDFVKMAMIGFWMNAPADAWALKHYEYTRKNRDDDYTDEMCDLHMGQAHNYALFAGLCLGYLLGLREIGQINDDEFMIGEAQLPGIMAESPQVLP